MRLLIALSAGTALICLWASSRIIAAPYGGYYELAKSILSLVETSPKIDTSEDVRVLSKTPEEKKFSIGDETGEKKFESF